jgi:hypothetical protein
MHTHEGFEKHTRTYLKVVVGALWVLMPLITWCILSISEFAPIDHLIGIAGAILLGVSAFALREIYQQSREALLLFMLAPMVLPILAYVYRVFM